MDELPVFFGREVLSKEDGRLDRKPLNNAVSTLLNDIWTASKFRFWLRRTTRRGLRFEYFCAQDSKRSSRTPNPVVKRDRKSQNAKFACESKLILRPCFQDRTLTVRMVHLHHPSYVDISVSPEITQFIDTHMSTSTPAQIFRDLRASNLPNARSVTQKQVAYQWRQGNVQIWKRDECPIKSASKLLSEHPTYEHETYLVGGLEGLAVFVSPSIRDLGAEARELAMDATFGTNSAGMSLFSVLAEVDGSGIPLAYCFVRVLPTADGSTPRPQPNATSQILVQLLRHLQAAGIEPAFFNTDKDFAEIGAVGLVWPNTKHQLCLWHAKRALRAKFKDANKTSTQARYEPSEAQKIVRDLEVCWGVARESRPNGPHKDLECNCPSRDETFAEKGRLEPSSLAEQNAIVDVFTRHFNAHSFIPDHNGTFRSKETIYKECSTEMYQWCRQRGYFRLWAYLFVQWYKPKMWILWARSENAEEIPVLKTTMVVESHWRLLKHDYLHRFNRPRVDMVVWIMLSRVIPDAIDRLQALPNGGSRLYQSSWRKAFKRQWTQLAAESTTDGRLNMYHTDPVAWTCGCDAYLFSRFLVCKHIVHCYELIARGSTAAEVFAGIRRCRTPPFWRAPEGLKLLEEYEVEGPLSEASATRIETESLAEEYDEDGAISESDSERESEIDDAEEDTLVPQEDSLVLQADRASQDRYCDNVQWYNDLLQRERLKGNTTFISEMQKCRLPGLGIEALREDVEHMESSTTSLTLWGRRKHPASMYLL